MLFDNYGVVMERVMRLGALNVVTQPHSAANYQSLLQATKKLRRAVRVRGDRFGLISILPEHAAPGGKGAFVDGQLALFTQIDEASDWINIRTGKKAEGDELSQVVIPRELRPNATFHYFRFYFQAHTLIFEVGNGPSKLTPGNTERLFSRLFSQPKIESAFGEVAITVYPQSDSVARILASKGIKQIHLVIYAPNSDNQKKAQVAFMERLEAMKARRLEEIYSAKQGEVIAPDPALVESAKVAATNGFVSANVVQFGKVVQVSTKDTPFIFAYTYDSASTIGADAFAQAAEEAFAHLTL